MNYKKILTSLCLLSVVMITQVTQSKEHSYLSINTTSSKEIAPDTAEISFAVNTSDKKSLQIATSNNKEIANRVVAELNKMINTNQGDYIKTSNFNASPIYSYENTKQIFLRYEVTNRVIVHTKSLDNLGKMIDTALSQGATNVDSLNFSLSNNDKQCNDLIVDATNKAKTRADKIAQTLQTKVIGIRTFDTSCSTNNYNTPRLYMAKNMLADTAEAMGNSTTISNGSIKLNANVNATFFLK